ncbi:CpsD/CapB family tyrosine-protein kinase [Vallitalea pronyensis]|uniref:non-specific protein-tyrosine kinase n=1 Tax=Vallitalea pronyensis TaxID=1348613 RepID=A0A8J8MNU1_9FIRM|nr:CpsD/CapB family tyrosine-protein kinase [Vallitalea pronyensis]QUI24991.1 CpsD/CapB family tyrosine-protein kinase [Vallitalea pronyensis]
MNRNLITYKNPKSPISESYRMLRTNLHYLNIDKENKAIVVTSSNPGEGKTTTMANLAITMSQVGQRVLLVECDLRKPRIHKSFRIANGKGLVNVIVEKVPVQDVIQKIDELPNLDIITSGPIPPDPTEILESQMMQELIAKFREAYDVILFDAPPVCSVTDAAVLTSLVDGVILVVASAETNIESAKLAKKLLNKVNGNILGVVLSKADTSKTGGYYYHYYEYGEEATTKKRRRKKRA